MRIHRGQVLVRRLDRAAADDEVVDMEGLFNRRGGWEIAYNLMYGSLE